MFLGTHYNIQPFKAVIDFGDWTTESWEVKEEQAPIPHAEILTIKELSEKYIKMSADSILLLIRQKGLKVDSAGQTMIKISELNGITPAKLYSFILPGKHEGETKSEVKPQIMGMGRKTIKELAKELGKEPGELIEVLKKKGISATPKDKIKSVAEDAGKTPMELFEMIK